MLRKLAAIAFGLTLSLLLLEGFLRLYDPLGQRLRGDRITLPTRTRTVFRNERNPRFDPEVVFSKNSIGFRGSDPPAAFDDALTLVAVGGSTTECILLSDGKDWPLVLGSLLAGFFSDVWINNAGLDGHSTYGHLALVRQRIAHLRPKVVLFLIGLNDVGRAEVRPNELALVDDGEKVPWSVRLARHSALVATALNLTRGWEAQEVGLTHRQIDLGKLPALPVGERRREQLMTKHRASLPGYAKRLEELVRLSRAAGMEPVFLTQPALYGSVVDGETGVDLAEVEVDRRRRLNGRVAWELLETYNDVARQVGSRQDVLVVDAARKLPKSSRLFYDFVHFTNEGADALARLAFDELCPFLARRFPQHVTKACPAPVDPPA